MNENPEQTTPCASEPQEEQKTDFGYMDILAEEYRKVLNKPQSGVNIPQKNENFLCCEAEIAEIALYLQKYATLPETRTPSELLYETATVLCGSDAAISGKDAPKSRRSYREQIRRAAFLAAKCHGEVVGKIKDASVLCLLTAQQAAITALMPYAL